MLAIEQNRRQLALVRSRRPGKYVATVLQVFGLWQDPQKRYNIFMNSFTETTWMGVVKGQLMKTYIEYPPRKLQSFGYAAP